MTPLLLALALAADPCSAPPPPPGGPDAAAARLYREVAEAERRAGADETAMLAYREALARDPGDEVSRAALDALCRARGAAPLLERGMRELAAGQLREAARSFEEARAAGAYASAALLEGVARYELGDDRLARAALQEAREDPAHRDTADLYLGFLALRDGDGEGAARALDAAARDPRLAEIAEPLARLARRTGPLTLTGLLSAGWDSNAQLAPSGTPLDTSQDGQLEAAAGALYRPSGEDGPYLSARGLFHQQLKFDDLDGWGLAGAAGWQLGRGGRFLVAEYGYEYRAVGGAPFLSAHGLRAAAAAPFGPLTLAAGYFLRFESYQGSLYAPFSGTFQGGEASASAAVARGGRLLCAYRVSRDGVDAPELSFVEHGPRIALRVELSPRTRLFLDGAVSWRGYNALDPQLGVTRADTRLDLAAAVEWELTARAFLRTSLEARQNWSNAGGFGYFRLAPTVSLGWVAGL